MQKFQNSPGFLYITRREIASRRLDARFRIFTDHLAEYESRILVSSQHEGERASQRGEFRFFPAFEPGKIFPEKTHRVVGWQGKRVGLEIGRQRGGVLALCEGCGRAVWLSPRAK